MNKWTEILVGLILVLLPVYVALTDFLGYISGLGKAALIFLEGGLVWLVGLIGLLFLMLGISDLKE